jgi:hypothetical protein
MVIQFCCRSKCPAVGVTENGDVIIFEQDPNEQYFGEITMNKDSFKDFVEACKEGKFDSLF